MKKVKLFLKVFVIIVIIVNLPIINKSILYELDQEVFKYSNADASFTYVERFGFLKDTYISKESASSTIEEMSLPQANREVFRLYEINPLCIWRWKYYVLVSSQFRYNSWNKIAPSRVPFQGIGRCQKF